MAISQTITEDLAALDAAAADAAGKAATLADVQDRERAALAAVETAQTDADAAQEAKTAAVNKLIGDIKTEYGGSGRAMPVFGAAGGEEVGLGPIGIALITQAIDVGVELLKKWLARRKPQGA